ncbi:MAG: hypothetical protein WBL15_03110 [Phycisphaerae bacterium]|mgnify:FL=1|nr:hypothetical protein [Phycisphaerae bacterium]
MRYVSAFIPVVFLFLMVGEASARPQVLEARYRPDQPFPEFSAFWFGDAALKAGKTLEEITATHRNRPVGGSLHVVVRNEADSAGTLKIEDVLLDGVSLSKAIAYDDQRLRKKFASLYFAKLDAGELAKLQAVGEPVWWKADPAVVAPGGVCEIIVRLRRAPRRGEVEVTLVHDGGRLPVKVVVREDPPRIESISFSADLRRAYLYFRYPGRSGLAPARFLLDGRPVEASVSAVTDPAMELVPVVIDFPAPLERGRPHHFAGRYADGRVASAAVRVFADEFAYGLWGGRGGKEGDTAGAQAYVRELVAHHINVQMPQVGSPMLSWFYGTEAGGQFCDRLGLRRMINEPGKWGTHDPYAFFIHDEPDCGDFKAKGVPADKMVGLLAQWCTTRVSELRAANAGVSQMLNLDMTFKPDNWYTYGQLPDVLSVDPYYQARLWETYTKHPERLALYRKATFVNAVATVARSASAPRPLHVILYASRRGRKFEAEQSQFFRYPTPEEKRIEVFYALAAGAKGLSFWWFTPTGQSQGMGANDPEARRLWREVGLLGAQVRTAAPVLSLACPAELNDVESDGLWVRSLAAGGDTIVLLVVNDQYENDAKGTTYQPVKQGRVSVTLPAWMPRAQAFVIEPEGVKDVSAKLSGQNLTLSLGDFPLTKLVVVTADNGLRAKLEERYKRQFAENVARLRDEGRGARD